jgi:hypothetical protein
LRVIDESSRLIPNLSPRRVTAYRRAISLTAWVAASADSNLLVERSACGPERLRSEFGDRWLATVATEAEHAGRGLRNHNVKHVELSPPGHSAVSATLCNASTPTRFYVQDDVWKAFVFLPQTRLAFFDKARNRVVTDCADDESNRDRFVEIKAISAETQKEWFREFVAIRQDCLAKSLS